MTLVDRAKAWLPPIDLADEPDFVIGALRVSPSRREVEVGGARRVLQRRVMQVLVALARPTSEVVSHAELISRCWGGLAVEVDAIGRCVGQLRRLAEQYPEPPFEIVTVAGVGYRLEPAATCGSTAPTLAPPPRSAPAYGWKRHRVRLSAAAAVVAVVAVAAWMVWRANAGSNEPPTNRIAVLPFATLTAGQDAQAFARGLAGQLQGVLNANAMQTVSPDDAMALRGPDRDRRIAQLGVKLLFDGEVRDDGGTIQVGIRLDDARQHVTLWTADLSAPARQSEALQAQAGARIVSVLACSQRALKPKSGLRDPSALALYLRACDLYVSSPGGSTDARDNYRLIESLRNVVAKAPDFAPARAALAKYLAWYAPRMPVERQATFRAEAEQQARRVLTADKTQPDAYLALERLQPWRNYADRERLLDQALSADPNWSNANSFMGELLQEAGRLKGAIDDFEHASAFDPFCLCTSTFNSLAMSGQTAAANAQIGRFRRLYPNLPAMWSTALSVYRIEGDWTDYNALLEGRASWPSSFTERDAAFYQLLAEAATTHRSATISAAREAILANDGIRPQEKISELAQLGLTDDAFRLGQVYASQPLSVYNAPTFLFSPATASLRRDRRFMSLAAQLGLVGYWRSTGKWPDFCAEPGLPYTCKAEAEKLASKHV